MSKLHKFGLVLGGVVVLVFVVPEVLDVQDLFADICENLAKTWADFC